MNIWANDILNEVTDAVNSRNFLGYKICTVKTVSPLIFTYEGIEIGTSLGDCVYINPLLVSDVINQDETTLDESQTFSSSTAYNSSVFTAIMQGTIPDFLEEFYLFYKNWQSIFVLNEKDLIAVYELKDGKYLVLQKIIEYKYNEEEEN